jgi:hypothetical protein
MELFLACYKLQYRVVSRYLQTTIYRNFELGSISGTSCTTIVRCYLRVVPLRTCSHLFRYDSGNATERDIDIDTFKSYCMDIHHGTNLLGTAA